MPAILIVDDNPIQAVTRRLILEKAHFPVVLAEDGATALAKFESGDQFGMIITDHCMPGMTGPELVKKLREQFTKEIAAKEKTIIPGDEIAIDFTSGLITWRGDKFAFPALGSVPQSLVIAQGVENLVAKRLRLG